MVESSIGHIRDLPHSAAEVPAAQKQEPWARLGVNVDHDFEPLYVVDPKKKSVVSEPAGEARSRPTSSCSRRTKTARARRSPGIWSQVLKPKVPVRRMVFHEITKQRDRAGARARRARSTTGLVDAQETRRILDRLYGYEVSPVLWRKVMKGLSAGRVQSVATRLVVERERERIEFRRRRVLGHRRHVRRPASSTRGSTAVDGRKRRAGPRLRPQRDADRRRRGPARRGDRARRSPTRSRAPTFAVRSVERKPYTRRPAAPFMTSTLQQEASRKLRFSAQHTMRVAQRLYENGYITYMRTDSTSLSETAIAAARDQARELYGADVRPGRAAALQPEGQERPGGARGDPPRRRPLPHARRGARRASSATRPRSTTWSGSGRSPRRWPTPAARPSRCGSARTRRPTARDAEFGTAGTVITFRGFMLAYEEGRDEAVAARRGGAAPAAARRGRRGSRRRALEPDGHSTTPARALHRGDARAGARGARHRPAVDVRVDHGHDPRPRLRAQGGPGARPVVPRLRGHEPARAALRRSSSTTSSRR